MKSVDCGVTTVKTLLLVAKLKPVWEMYDRELSQIFEGYLNIIPYLHTGDGEEFAPDSGVEEADLVVITNPYSFPQARRRMGANAKIINLEFAFSKERVEALKAFPVGTEALACFNFYSTAHQAVNALYAAGVTNLNLYVHYPGNRNLVGKRIDLAVVSGRTEELPPGIPQVFDLGPRKLSLSTLLEIAVKAGILDGPLERSILRYCDTISTPDDYLSYFFDNSASSAMQLKAITECIDYGIAMFDPGWRVISCNEHFKALFSVRGDLTGRTLEELPGDRALGRFLRESGECRNRLFPLENPSRSLLVSKEKINKGDERLDLFIVLLKDVTEVTNLEHSLRRQLAKRGHVARHTFDGILGESDAMAACVAKARRIAQIDKPTLIIGESGTGKELFAQSICNASARAKLPFVAMNCAAIPSTLLESELFGYDEGAFTGARKGGKEGLFQLAHKGTLFLDEIGELSLPTQAKLLRVLEEKEVMKIGSGELTAVDVRIIAATNRDLNALVDSGDFRLDLYYRLNTLTIHVPPLRERRGDIPGLVEAFLRQEKLSVTFSPEVWEFLMGYQWRGNIRELRNCVEYMGNIADGLVTELHLPDYMRQAYDLRRRTGARWRSETTLMSDSDRESALNVLALLKRRPAGRRELLRELGEGEAEMTEYRLRGLLDCLARGGYLQVGRGRRGCTLTPAGERLLGSLLRGAEDA